MDFRDRRTLDFIKRSMAEDIGVGDHSSLAAIPSSAMGNAHLLFKESGIVAGFELAKVILETLDPEVQVEFLKKDGDRVNSGDIGMKVFGNVRAFLGAERLLLNCLQRLSGIAYTTRQIVDLVSDTDVKILDTRKTTPGMRFLEKWAVTVGGGFNHRLGLFDMIMLKDNHVDYAGGITKAVERAVLYLKEQHLDLPIEVETRNLDEVKEALATRKVDRIMFDNFSPELIREAIAIVRHSCETEASGGITIDNIRPYAETGVDYISIGALSHSVKSLDISFKQG
jgi:nicotinate-nucleotide pyrophosphorylase (carboxylating)